jgi:hypothetical protein
MDIRVHQLKDFLNKISQLFKKPEEKNNTQANLHAAPLPETKPPAETKQRPIETKPPVEARPSVDTKPLADKKPKPAIKKPSVAKKPSTYAEASVDKPADKKPLEVSTAGYAEKTKFVSFLWYETTSLKGQWQSDGYTRFIWIKIEQEDTRKADGWEVLYEADPAQNEKYKFIIKDPTGDLLLMGRRS